MIWAFVATGDAVSPEEAHSSTPSIVLERRILGIDEYRAASNLSPEHRALILEKSPESDLWIPAYCYNLTKCLST